RLPVPADSRVDRRRVSRAARRRFRAPRRGRARSTQGARREGCGLHRRRSGHRCLPHGVLRRSGRQPDGLAPPLRAARLMATLTRDEAAKRFDELPLPTTADEHWRFTDLRGFSVPEEVSDTAVSDTKPALDLDVAGMARVTETGIEIASAPEGVT